MKNKIAKIIVYVVAVFSAAVFTISRLSYLPESFLDMTYVEPERKGTLGDLYFMCRIDYFKIPTPEFAGNFGNSSRNSSLNDADILVFGDSYFGLTRVLKNFPDMIRDSLGLKVRFERQNMPLESLADYKPVSDKRKILLYEATDKRIFDDFKKKHEISTEKRKFLGNILNTVMPKKIELRYLYLLQNSVLTSKIYSFVMNLRFNALGLISDLTPVYSKNPPFLFYYQSVNKQNTSFYYRFSDGELSNTADNLKSLSDRLNDDYNLEFVFMPVPSSYTINHRIINQDEYNMLLPKLFAELDKRNVRYINLYDLFLKSEKLLYYPTDTHWNEEGMKIAFDEFKKYYSAFTGGSAE